MRREKFKIKAAPGQRFAPGVTEATVVIEHMDEERALFIVRPYKSPKTYTWPLEAIARDVIFKDAALKADFDLRPRRSKKRG